MGGMNAPKHHCSKCGATLPFKPRVMQAEAKCHQCGALHKPPTYWESLADGEKVCAVFVMIGIGCVAVVIGFLLFLKALSWVLDILPSMY